MEINPDAFNDVCKFGPGGEYTWFWPSGQNLPELPSNKLSQVLAKLNEIINGAINQASGRKYFEVDFDTVIVQEVKDGFDQPITQRAPDAEADAAACRDIILAEEPLLFADDRRACGIAAVKPKHRVRASRRIAKKRVPVGPVEQGSLFDACLQGI